MTNIIPLKPIKRLICACCGETTRGRQWFNRDTGYGLCTGCVDYCQSKLDNEEFKECYGIRGIHFDIEVKNDAK